jgi:molybdopterin-synthase adenylyltransferase
VNADDAGDRGAARPRFVDLEGRLVALRPSVEVFPAADGDVYLLRTGGAPALVVRQAGPEDRALLERLATAPITVAPGSEHARRLAPLEAAGLLTARPPGEPLPADRAERFARQLPYFAEHGDPADVQRRLGAATVAVIGCGGLGTWTLGALAALGVGRFTLVDDDTVELANLNRQIVFAMPDLGARKVDCAARWVHALDPEIEVRTIAGRVDGDAAAAAAIEGADVAVLAADWPPYELGRWVNRACVDAGVPFITAGQQPPLLKVGPVYALADGPCFACHERQLATRFPLYPELADYRRDHPGIAMTLGPASGVVGTLVALEVMHLLAGVEPLATAGRAMLIDMHTLTQRWEDIERDPECLVCGMR